MKHFFKIIVLFCLTSSFFSCDKYKELLSEAEKVRIVFFSEEGDKYVEITGKKEIIAVSKYISNVSSPVYKCGYEGKIEFYCKNGNILLDADFNTDCNTIVFEYGDKLYSKRITKDGLDYLKGIESTL